MQWCWSEAWLLVERMSLFLKCVYMQVHICTGWDMHVCVHLCTARGQSWVSFLRSPSNSFETGSFTGQQFTSSWPELVRKHRVPLVSTSLAQGSEASATSPCFPTWMLGTNSGHALYKLGHAFCSLKKTK